MLTQNLPYGEGSEVGSGDGTYCQSFVRLPLPIVDGSKEYRQHKSLLERMDEILRLSGIEEAFVQYALQQEQTRVSGMDKPLTDRRRASVQQFALQSLRCGIARILSGESHRQFSVHLADSELLKWFCHYNFIGLKRAPAKSTLQRMEESVPRDMLEQITTQLIKSAAQVDDEGNSILKCAQPIDLTTVWMDCTCAKLDIHFPADWSLLRDGVRSIMRSIMVIRSHGLVHRLPDPYSFVAEINKHAMAMSGASRRGRGGDKKKQRKKTLRSMKKLVRKVVGHGKRYRTILAEHWVETDLSEAQAARIIDRLEHLLDVLPQAARQAHERIIGERVVPNDGKILSLYQPHAQVYVRGKAGADAEFGLQMLLCESAEGLILDCTLTDDAVASDSTLLLPAIHRMRQWYGDHAVRAAVTDRGFASTENSQALTAAGVVDFTAPRSPAKLEERLLDESFRRAQRRRAQTEARIGIFKAGFIGERIPTRCKEAQHRFVAWARLAHNLWVLARLETTDQATEAA
jgi:IS5 family transposase